MAQRTPSSPVRTLTSRASQPAAHYPDWIQLLKCMVRYICIIYIYIYVCVSSSVPKSSSLFCGWFQPTSFLTAFFHKLWIPLHLNSSQGAQGPLVSLVPMKTLTSGCENVPAWCTWMTYPICWGHSWWSYSYPLVFYGIRPTQEPACRHSVISWSRLIEQYWFFF